MRWRADADERAGRRFAVAAVSLVAVGAAIGLLGLLVRDRWDPLIDLDNSTTRQAERASALVPLAKVLTWFGAPWVMTALAAVLAALLWRAGRRRLALYVVVCRAGAALLSTTVKVVFDRTRPVFEDPVSHASGPSFPSGHTLAAASFWAAAAVVALPHVRRALALGVAVVVPVVVATTRVLLGVHFLSDVVAGLVLGTGWTVACTVLFAVWSAEEGHPVDPLDAGLEPPDAARSSA